MILPAAVVARLNDQFNICLTGGQGLVETVIVRADSDEPDSEAQSKVDDAVVSSVPNVESVDQGSVFLDVDQVDGRSIDPSVASVAELPREQQADRSLAGSWQFARCGKGNCVVKDVLLFCREKV